MVDAEDRWYPVLECLVKQHDEILIQGSEVSVTLSKAAHGSFYIQVRVRVCAFVRFMVCSSVQVSLPHFRFRVSTLLRLKPGDASCQTHPWLAEIEFLKVLQLG